MNFYDFFYSFLPTCRWVGDEGVAIFMMSFLIVFCSLNERQLKIEEQKKQWATTAQSTIEQSEKKYFINKFCAFSHVKKKSDLNSFERKFAVVGGSTRGDDDEKLKMNRRVEQIERDWNMKEFHFDWKTIFMRAQLFVDAVAG